MSTAPVVETKDDTAPLRDEERAAIRALLRQWSSFSEDQARLLEQLESKRSTLREAMSKAQENAEAVVKKSDGKHGKYASTESVLKVVKEATAGLGIWWRGKRCPIHRNDRGEAVGITRVICFTDASGEEVDAETDWGVDLIRNKDGQPTRSEEKSIAAAQTSALGYLLRDAFGLPRLKEEDMDHETEEQLCSEADTKEIEGLAKRLKEDFGLAKEEVIALVRKAAKNPDAVKDNGRFYLTPTEAGFVIAKLRDWTTNATSGGGKGASVPVPTSGTGGAPASRPEPKVVVPDEVTPPARGAPKEAPDAPGHVHDFVDLVDKERGRTGDQACRGCGATRKAQGGAPAKPPFNAREKVDKLAAATAEAIRRFGVERPVAMGLLNKWSAPLVLVNEAGKFTYQVDEAAYERVAAEFKKWWATLSEALKGASAPARRHEDEARRLEEEAERARQEWEKSGPAEPGSTG